MPQDPVPPQDFRGIFGAQWLTVSVAQSELADVRTALQSCPDLPPDLLDLATLAESTARLLRVGLERARTRGLT
jgi:hypothetical protein